MLDPKIILTPHPTMHHEKFAYFINFQRNMRQNFSIYEDKM